MGSRRPGAVLSAALTAQRRWCWCSPVPLCSALPCPARCWPHVKLLLTHTHGLAQSGLRLSSVLCADRAVMCGYKTLPAKCPGLLLSYLCMHDHSTAVKGIAGPPTASSLPVWPTLKMSWSTLDWEGCCGKATRRLQISTAETSSKGGYKRVAKASLQPASGLAAAAGSCLASAESAEIRDG